MGKESISNIGQYSAVSILRSSIANAKMNREIGLKYLPQDSLVILRITELVVHRLLLPYGILSNIVRFSAWLDPMLEYENRHLLHRHGLLLPRRAYYCHNVKEEGENVESMSSN